MINNKNLIIAPCGNKSNCLIDYWYSNYEKKEFDVCILFYDKHIDFIDRFNKVEYFYHLMDFKYKMIYNLVNNINSEIVEKYKYFYFLDDDIEIDTESINKIFQLSKVFDISIASASLTSDSFYSWKLFKNQKHTLCRFVGQIEVMAPIFSKESLLICLPTFIENDSSWGIELMWSKLLGYPQNKMVVFDCVEMKHSNPVGHGDLYKKLTVKAEFDLSEVMNKYNLKTNLVEYSRIIELNNKNYFYMYFILKIYERVKIFYSIIIRNLK